jgi:hypothetical protein
MPERQSTCTACGGDGIVIARWLTPDGGLCRRLCCRDCGNRWSHVAEDASSWPRQRRSDAKLSDEQVIEALTSSAPARELAERFGVSASAVKMIRRRQIYRHVRPDLPPWTRPRRPPKPRPPRAPRPARRSCSSCREWLAGEHRCRQGWPDPIVDGMFYANECNDYESI